MYDLRFVWNVPTFHKILIHFKIGKNILHTKNKKTLYIDLQGCVKILNALQVFVKCHGMAWNFDAEV